MANPTNIYGLKPVRMYGGAPYNGATIKAYCSANYATALFVGDPVVWDTTLANKDATGRYPTIIKSAGTAGTLVRGVIVSFDPTDRDSTVYRAASTERIANIAVDPDIVYSIRDDGGTALTAVTPGQNAVMVADSAGSTVTGLSGMALDTGTATAPNTTQNFTLHILGRVDSPDNSLAADAEWEVLLNTCENATGRFLGVTAA
jgi:hypothetical protein